MKIKELRQKLNLSQIEISKKLNIPQQTYCNYEIGRSEPSIRTLIELADFFNVSIDELTGRDTDLLNLKFLDEDQSLIIRTVLRMNKEELMYTKKFVHSIMTDV
mgnify:FL=1